MPRRSVKTGIKYKRDKQGQFAKVNTLRKLAPNPHQVKRREIARKILKTGVLYRKNVEFAEDRQGKSVTPKVALEVEKAHKRAAQRKTELEGLRSEMASQKRLAHAKQAGDVAFRRRRATPKPKVEVLGGGTGPKNVMPQGLSVGQKVTSRKLAGTHEIAGPTRHPDVVKLRDIKNNVTVDALVSEIKPKATGRPTAKLDRKVVRAEKQLSEALRLTDDNRSSPHVKRASAALAAAAGNRNRAKAARTQRSDALAQIKAGPIGNIKSMSAREAGGIIWPVSINNEAMKDYEKSKLRTRFSKGLGVYFVSDDKGNDLLDTKGVAKRFKTQSGAARAALNAKPENVGKARSVSKGEQRVRGVNGLTNSARRAPSAIDAIKAGPVKGFSAPLAEKHLAAFEASGQEVGRIRSNSRVAPSVAIKARIEKQGSTPDLRRRLRAAEHDEQAVRARHPFAGKHPRRAEAMKASGLGGAKRTGNPIAEISKGVMGSGGHRIKNTAEVNRVRGPMQHQFVRPTAKSLEGFVPGEGISIKSGTSSPTFASKIKVGDVIAVRQQRQSAYNSPSMHTTTHSKSYEVVSVGEDAHGLFFKLTQPGRAVKGKGGVRWRPHDLDTRFGIQRNR